MSWSFVDNIGGAHTRVRLVLCTQVIIEKGNLVDIVPTSELFRMRPRST